MTNPKKLLVGKTINSFMNYLKERYREKHGNKNLDSSVRRNKLIHQSQMV
jgi:hypothetical protein